MALKSLKLRLTKNCSSLSSSSSEKDQPAQGHEETEATLSEDDDTKYGYNAYDDADQEPKIPITRRSSTGSPNRAERRGSSQSHHSHISQRTPRRSSLKKSDVGTPRQTRRHSLTFSNDVTVATITPTKHLAKKKSLWFEEKDYEKMHQKVHLIAERAKEGDDKKYCTRGLESIIREDCETRRYAAWDAVLDEQEYQKESGMDHYDNDALSNSYREACAESRAEASMRALQDQKAVAEYLSETRKYCRRMSM